MSNGQHTYSHRYRAKSRQLATSTIVGLVATAIVSTIGTGAALADPSQGGVTPSGPSQGGVTPSAPTQQGGVTSVPDPDPGPGAIPDPPQEAPYRSVPSYDGGTGGGGTVTPQQIQPIISHPEQGINRNAPVQPIAPPEGTVRIGTFIEKKPAWLSDRDARSINRWAAFGEAKISQSWRALGVPDKEADRRAAATILGVAVGGTAGATVLGVPAALVGGGVGAGVGAITGALIGASPIFAGTQAGPGALIGAGVGAAVGAAVLGIPAALVGAVGGGLLGGVIGQVYGGGDSKADPNQPLLPWQEPQIDNSPKVYQLNLPAQDAQRAGLPAVDYTVNVHGDVRAQVGDSTFTWTGAQAQAPYKALGGAADAAQHAASDLTRQAGDALHKVLPGVKINYIPLPPPPPKPVRR